LNEDNQLKERRDEDEGGRRWKAWMGKEEDLLRERREETVNLGPANLKWKG